MKAFRILGLAFLIAVGNQLPAQDADLDKQLTELATKLSTQIQENKKTKVAVLDFTDLQGNATEFGRYVAEELTVNLVMAKKGFSVLDRANLQRILAEHKLTATGLIDPENAKKLGQFAGVDALILGNLVTLNQSVQLTAKIITTDTAEIVGAAKGFIKVDGTVQGLLDRSADSRGGGSAIDAGNSASIFSKTFDDLRVEVKTFSIIQQKYFKLVMELTNLDPQKSSWVALESRSDGVTDSAGSLFQMDSHSISGVTACSERPGYFAYGTEIKAKESRLVTVPLAPVGFRSYKPTPGKCELQLGIHVKKRLQIEDGEARFHNLVLNLDVK